MEFSYAHSHQKGADYNFCSEATNRPKTDKLFLRTSVKEIIRLYPLVPDHARSFKERFLCRHCEALKSGLAMAF